MKKQLMVSTALVGGALIFAGPAAAQVDISFAGSLDFQSGYHNSDEDDIDGSGSDNSQHDFITDTEIHFLADGQADNGLSYGAKVELEADGDQTNNSDEARIHAFGSWGRIELGDEDGAEDRMAYDAGLTQSGVGGIDGDIDRWYNNTAGVTSFPDIIDSSDSTKVTYFSPRISGFQVGVSYTPSVGNIGQEIQGKSDSFEDHIGLGANYQGEFSGFDVGISVVGGIADDAADTSDDIENFAVGGYVGFQGITVGGSVGVNGDSGPTDDAIFYDIGVGYAQGPYSVSVGYLYSEAEADSDFGGGDETFSNIAISGGYQIADGLYAYVDLMFAESDSDTFDDNDGTVFLAGAVLSF